MDADQILSLKPDVVILATGAVPIEPQIPNEGIPIVQALDVLSGKVLLRDNVLIVGGGLVGLETCQHVLSQNRKATIVEMQGSVGEDMHPSIKYFIFKSFAENNVEVLVNTKVENFTKDGAICTNPSGTIKLSDFDMVILALGAKSFNPLEKDLVDKVKTLHVIGDAAKPRNALAAIEEGARLALDL